MGIIMEQKITLSYKNKVIEPASGEADNDNLFLNPYPMIILEETEQ